MRLILSSAGFRTISVAFAAAKMAGKLPEECRVAVINEAYVPERYAHRWVVDELVSITTNVGGPIDLVNLLALPLDEVQERVLEADVLYVMGGNTDYLAKIFVDTGFAAVLPELLKNVVYVGSSAGSQVVAKRGGAAYQELCGETPDFGTTHYLDLVNVSIMPHFMSPYFVHKVTDVALLSSKGMSWPLYALCDDAALVINDSSENHDLRDTSTWFTIGTPPVIAQDGVQLQ